MKDLHARAQTAVTASIDESLQLLRAVEAYPEWYPTGVKSASVLERDSTGRPTTVRATLHVATGPFVKDFALTLVMTEPSPGVIKLTRQPHGAGDNERFDVTWTVTPGAAGPGAPGANVALALDATLSVPRLVPVGGVAEGIANGFVAAAATRLRR